ncbi:MAG: hypothetical protein ACXAD7_22740 [Candidatus Kariarchaeaceae archaeon]
MKSTQFRSSSFYLSQWASEEQSVQTPSRPDPIALDIVESQTTRQVCEGTNCSLYFDQAVDIYQTIGCCQRSTLCTEARILKDKLYVKKGSVSNTIHSVNHENQLLNWDVKSSLSLD